MISKWYKKNVHKVSGKCKIKLGEIKIKRVYVHHEQDENMNNKQAAWKLVTCIEKKVDRINVTRGKHKRK